MLIPNITTNWNTLFNELWKDEEFVQLLNKVEQLYLNSTVYPKKEEIFKCFNYFNIEDTKVVIIGQDPYYNPEQANGLAFSVNQGIKTPKSLINIFKELDNDLHIKRTNADLTDWAKQGVLLLNTSLTVESGKPNSHHYLNWSKYTDKVIKYLSKHVKHVVYILWGNNAISKSKLIDINNNYIISSSHPSPLSAYVSFFNSNPFSRTNDDLMKNNRSPIKW